jgi:uncharacterized protein YoxC
MSVWITQAGDWLLQGAAALPDTLYTKQIVEEPGMFARMASIASGLVSITLLVLTAALVPAAWNFRKSYKKVNKLLDRIENDIAPIMRHASTIADNVDYITTSVRVDVQEVNRTIAAANLRLREATAMTERRVKEFNAFLEVVQREAEGVFVSTAATVRGMRAGAAAMRQPPDDGTATAAGDPAAGDRPPVSHDGLDEFDEYLEEDYDGDVSRRTSPDYPPAPRIRRRGGPRGPA